MPRYNANIVFVAVVVKGGDDSSVMMIMMMTVGARGNGKGPRLRDEAEILALISSFFVLGGCLFPCFVCVCVLAIYRCWEARKKKELTNLTSVRCRASIKSEFYGLGCHS